jgi:hypothetical protein
MCCDRFIVHRIHPDSRFKLHLRPKTKSAANVTDKILPLPKGKTAIDVFADFLRYLYQCAQKYVEETHANGVSLWEILRPTSEFVLTHPNGWEGAQQGMMRRAAVTAGLIPEGAAGQARLSFVTEGEASLHFCIQNGLTNEAVKVRNLSAHFSGVPCPKPHVGIRAGKASLLLTLVAVLSTLVPTSRNRTAVKPLKRLLPHSVHIFPSFISSYVNPALETGFFKGSIFVTSNAKDFLDSQSFPLYFKRALTPILTTYTEILQGSTYLDDAPDIARRFDKTTKLRFRDPEEPQYIKFGSLKDKDPRVGIRSGQIRLNGCVLMDLYEVHLY